MKITQLNTGIVRFIRFCKNNDLYFKITLKYKSINYLQRVLMFCPIDQYLIKMINFLPDNGDYVYFGVDINTLDKEWKIFANDLIIKEKEAQKLHKELIEHVTQMFEASRYIAPYYTYSLYDENEIINYLSQVNKK